jgi:hypothetical protein
MRRLADFFVFNRRTELAPSPPLFTDRKLNYGVWLLQLGVGVAAIIVCSTAAYKDAVKAATHLQGPLRGIWSVDQFALDNVLRPPLLTDTERWQRVIFDAPDILTLQSMDGTQTKFYMQLTDGNKHLTLWAPPDTHSKGNLSVDNSQPDRVTLDGKYEGRHVNATLQRVDLSDPQKFLLLNRGVHWVTDYPHNR